MNAAGSVVTAAALLLCAVRRSRLTPYAVAAAAAFQAASLAAVVLTRTGSLLGWSESTWTLGASQSAAVEVGALVGLAAVAAVAALDLRQERRQPVTVSVR